MSKPTPPGRWFHGVRAPDAPDIACYRRPPAWNIRTGPPHGGPGEHAFPTSRPGGTAGATRKTGIPERRGNIGFRKERQEAPRAQGLQRTPESPASLPRAGGYPLAWLRGRNRKVLRAASHLEFRYSFSSEHHATPFLPDSHFVAQGLRPNDPYGNQDLCDQSRRSCHPRLAGQGSSAACRRICPADPPCFGSDRTCEGPCPP